MDILDSTWNEVREWLPMYKTAIAGGIAGSMGKTATAPLSRMTVLYQVNPGLMNHNLMAAYQHILRHEGILSLWKGNLTSVVHRFPYSAINFTVYENLRKVIRGDHQNLGRKETVWTRLLCGSVSGAAACCSCYPLEIVRTRLTASMVAAPVVVTADGKVLRSPPLATAVGANVDGSSSSSGSRASSSGAIGDSSSSSSGSKGSSRSSSSAAASAGKGRSGSSSTSVYRIIRHILVNEGLRGLFRGMGVSVMVAVPNIGTSFAVYGTAKDFFVHSPYITARGLLCDPVTGNFTMTGGLITGSISGMLSVLLTFPLDTIRRRLQYSQDSVQEGIIKEFRSIIAHHNGRVVSGLYKGVVPELLRVIPMVAITFATYEFVCTELDRLGR